jgi:nucleoside-diphosphate-sugar epimerase
MDARTMNILITGSSGFIARFLIPALAAKGHAVIGIDNRTGPAFGDYFRFVHGNILDDGALESAMSDVDLIIHLAAEHKDFGIPESLYYQVNVDGTEKLLQHAGRRRIRNFIFFSSVAVYGDSPVPTNETSAPAPESPYGKSKLLAEKRLEAWAGQAPDRKVVIVRPTVIFGPYNYANMYRLVQSVARRRYVGVGDGANIKSIGYVENIAAAASFLTERMEPGVEIYNYADSPHMPTRDLIACIAKSLRVKVPSLRIPTPLAVACAFPLDLIARAMKKDLPLTAKRIAKFTISTQHHADKLLRAGFVPPCSLETGIQRTTAWYSADRRTPPHEAIGTDAA